VAGPYLPAHLDPIAIGEPHVQHGHVGPCRRDPAQRLFRGAGLTDHLEVVLGLEQVPQAPAHDLMVIKEEHPCGPSHVVQSRKRGYEDPESLALA